MIQFRSRALKQLEKPDELDLLARVTRLRGWLTLGILGLIVVGVIVYGFVGSLNSEVSGPGLLSRPQGVSIIESTVEGQVLSLYVKEDTDIKAGARIATVRQLNGTVTTIHSHWGGHIVGIQFDEGNVIQVGTPLLLMERSNVPDNRLVAFLFLPSGTGSFVAPGMPVDLDVSSAPSGSYGVLHGTVTSVDPFPATVQEVENLISDQQLTAEFTANGPPTIVTVDLVRDSATPSGYQWSTAKGPPYAIGSGIQVTGTIVQGTEAPIRLVFGK